MDAITVRTPLAENAPSWWVNNITLPHPDPGQDFDFDISMDLYLPDLILMDGWCFPLHFMDGDSYSDGLEITILSDGTIEIFSWLGAWEYTDPGTFVTAQWNTLRVVKSGTTMDLYLNGSPELSCTHGADFSVMTVCLIGGDPDDTQETGWFPEDTLIKNIDGDQWEFGDTPYQDVEKTTPAGVDDPVAAIENIGSCGGDFIFFIEDEPYIVDAYTPPPITITPQTSDVVLETFYDWEFVGEIITEISSITPIIIEDSLVTNVLELNSAASIQMISEESIITTTLDIDSKLNGED